MTVSEVDTRTGTDEGAQPPDRLPVSNRLDPLGQGPPNCTALWRAARILSFHLSRKSVMLVLSWVWDCLAPPCPRWKVSLHQCKGEEWEPAGGWLGFIFFVSVHPVPWVKEMLKVCISEQSIINHSWDFATIYLRYFFPLSLDFQVC